MNLVRYDTIIVGAGISGLTLGYRLKQAGQNIKILEANAAIGGVMQSQELKTPFGKAPFELGPNTVPSSAKDFLALASKLNITPIHSSALANKRYIFLQNKLQSVPSDPLSFLTSPILSPLGKLAILQDFYKPVQSHQEISIANFIEQRFGRELLDNLITPALTGIYAGNPELMSLQATFPFLVEWEQSSGSVIRGAIKALKAKKNASSSSGKKVKSHLVSFRQGIVELPNALAHAIGIEHIECNQPVENIEKLPDGYRLSTDNRQFEAANVVFATPAKIASKLLKQYEPQIGILLEAIPYAPMNLVYLGFDKARLQKDWGGFGFLVPRKQTQMPYIHLLGGIWNSCLFPDKYPQQLAFATHFQGGMFHPELNELSDEALIQKTTEELRIIYEDESLQPIISHVQRWKDAIPQYTFGHLERLNSVNDILQNKLPGIHLLGNYQSGVSLNDCIKNANKLAEDLINSGLSRPSVQLV